MAIQMTQGPEVKGSNPRWKREFLENSEHYLRCDSASVKGTLCSAKLGCRVAQLVKCLFTSGYPDGSRSRGKIDWKVLNKDSHPAVMEQWKSVLGKSFWIQCGVRQGRVLSPYLFAPYIDDVIKALRNSGYGIFVGSIFAGCILYADDIVLLSCSFCGLQKMVNICATYGVSWDIQFNSSKSQCISFGGFESSTFTLHCMINLFSGYTS